MSAVTSIAERAKQRPELWYPTSCLRIAKRLVSPGQCKPLGPNQTISVEPKYSRKVQQKFVSNHGHEEWRDLEEVEL